MPQGDSEGGGVGVAILEVRRERSQSRIFASAARSFSA
jgi:hypothetical protein